VIKPILEQHLDILDYGGPLGWILDTSLSFQGLDRMVPINEFLEWVQTVERIFEYKEIPKDKTVKLVALKLRKYASLWWTKLLSKSVGQGTGKIWTSEKMKTNLKGWFLPPTYI